MLTLHILFGISALFTGVAILAMPKGTLLHKRLGKVFITTLFITALGSAYLAYTISEPPLMGGLCIYLLITSWLTIKRRPNFVNYLDKGLAVIICLISVGLFIYADDFAQTGDKASQVPIQVFYVFASIAAVCAALDTNMLFRGGLDGKQRLARHIWRMFGAMIFALMALLGQNIYPDWAYDTGILFFPLLLIVALLIYWLIQILYFNRRFTSTPSAGNSSPN